MRTDMYKAASIRNQHGVSLLIVMILLLVMSVLGIAILRSSAMQERMSANLRDRSLAFQAAEAALREAQDTVLGAAPVAGDPNITWDNWVATTQTCNARGLCPTGAAARWTAGPTLGSSPNPTASSQYWMEDLGVAPGEADPDNNCLVHLREASSNPPANCQSRMFRTNARSRADGRAEVVVQANLVSRIPDL